MLRRKFLHLLDLFVKRPNAVTAWSTAPRVLRTEFVKIITPGLKSTAPRLVAAFERYVYLYFHKIRKV